MQALLAGGSRQELEGWAAAGIDRLSAGDMKHCLGDTKQGTGFGKRLGMRQPSAAGVVACLAFLNLSVTSVVTQPSL